MLLHVGAVIRLTTWGDETVVFIAVSVPIAALAGFVRARSLLYRRSLIVKKVALVLKRDTSERISSPIARLSKGISTLTSTIGPTLDGVTLDAGEVQRALKVRLLEPTPDHARARALLRRPPPGRCLVAGS